MAYLFKARLRLRGGGANEAGQNREGGLGGRGRGGTCMGKIGRYNAF